MDELIKDLVDRPYAGHLPLVEINHKLIGLEFPEMQSKFSELIEIWIQEKRIAANPVTAQILTHLGDIHSVADMAKLAQLSPRQLQRILKQTTGFSPHDFLKVLRLQQSFKQDYLDYYANQAHDIHSFRKITGYTPNKYSKKFDV